MEENDLNIEHQLKNLAVRGFGFLIIKRILSQFIITGGNLILVRLLFPQDFGIFAILQSLTSILWIMGDFGLGRALLQSKKNPTREIIQTAFLFHLLVGICIAGIGYFLSPYLLAFYDVTNKHVILGLQLLFVSQIFINVSSISSNMLEREMKYKNISIAEIMGLFITQIVIVFFAFLDFGIVSFIIGTIVGRISLCIIYFLFFPVHFGIIPKTNEFKKILNFGFASQIGVFFSILSTTFIPLYLGRFPGRGNFTGFESVAFVTFSSGVAVTIIALSSIVDQICFSVLSRLQHNKVTSQKVFISMLRLLAITTFFAGGVTLALASELIRIVYTQEWLPASSALRLAVIQMIGMAFTSLSLNALLAFGESKFYRNIFIAIAIIQWILIIPFVFYFGFVGVSLAGAIASIVSIFAYRKLKTYFTLSFTGIIAVPFLVSSFISIVLYVLTRNYFIDSILQLLLIIIFSFIIYISILFSFYKKEFSEYAIIAKEIFVKKI